MRIPYLIGRSVAGMALAGVGLVNPLSAGESVTLSTGYRLHADRHEASGDQMRFYQGAGYIELPASMVTGFEPDEPVLAPVFAAVAAPVALPVPVVVPETVAITPTKTPHELAAAAAQKYSLPESFVRSVMKAESNFRADALSPKGAIGLMQLMQATAQQLGVNPKDPKQNAEGGARYLRELLAKYENNPNQVILALAAYNAGPEAVERYHGVPPFRETREYILRVLRSWDRTAGH